MNLISTELRPSVQAARLRWNAQRQEIQARHAVSSEGLAICHQLSDLLDSILLELYRSALPDFSAELQGRISLVLLGGSGRRDIAPFSDVDLLLLYQGALTDELVEFSRRISQDVTDTGLPLGYSRRTPAEACSAALQDAFILSSITEARYLCGDRPLFSKFKARFKRIVMRRASSMIRGIIAAREEERVEFGETVYLLRPNLKKSRGGLRDIHLIRWLGFVRYGETDLNQLLSMGGLSTADTRQLNASSEFLLKIRNEMHFHAGKAEDMLGRDEQVRLASRYGYEDDGSMLPVEAFMRDYFRYTSRIGYICDHFVSKSLNRRQGAAAGLWSPLFEHEMNGHFLLGPTHIGIKRTKLAEIKSDLEEVLQLMQLASLYGKGIEHKTWIAIRHEMLKNRDIKFTSECANRFMALLSSTNELARLLRRLHEMLVLEKIIPGFQHARGLMQFNEYHMYTVDEHSLRAVGHALEYEHDSSLVGEVYRGIKKKNLLHLALLLHDLGKGFAEDHCDVGARIAVDTGERFRLGEEATEKIRFLVQNHLVMSHLAFHRDINDMPLVAEFASNVGSMELLSMLYVLTCADISAVGPGVLSPWKQGLLDELFQNAKTVLTGESDRGRRQPHMTPYYDAVAAAADDQQSAGWLQSRAATLPNNFLRTRSPDTVAAQLKQLQHLTREDIRVWINPLGKTNLYEVCIGKLLRPRSGNFHKLTGMLSSMGLQIISADIKMLDGSLVWYWFQYRDNEFEIAPPSRLADIRQRTLDLINGVSSDPPKFRKVWGADSGDSIANQLSRPKINVRVDNQTVSWATIIDVFAYDKLGLLYRMTKKIYKLGLDLKFARVATYGHQVIDVFYVTDEQGNKIRNKNQIQIIKQELLDTVTNFLTGDPQHQDNHA